MPQQIYAVSQLRSDSRPASAPLRPGTAVALSDADTYGPPGDARDVLNKRGLRLANDAVLNGVTSDHTYAAGQLVSTFSPLPGERVNVLVKAGETIAVGDGLVVEGGGSGLFVKAVAGDVRHPLVAVGASGGALPADTHIRAVVQ